MRVNAKNKENIAPKARTDQQAITATERNETSDVENPAGFVEINRGSVNSQIEESPIPNSISIALKTENRGKEVDRTDDGEGLEMDEGDMDGLGSTDSSVNLGDVGLEELLEIEKENPDDLGPLEPPTGPHTPFQDRSLRSQPLAEIYPPGLNPKELPAPLNINKPSYFTKDNPMKADSKFEEGDEDSWFEEGEVDNDGIRREEVEMSFAEWHLGRDPRLGKYRVKTLSCLRVCWTIHYDDAPR